jgi:hypothetical protein
MQIFQQEYDDGVAEIIKANASISYASALEPCDKTIKSRAFRALASMQDSDLYYTQSILVTSSWNKNDDVFDKHEIWAARHSPEHKPTNLEHDEGTIIGHIVSNYPITEDGILIDENTPIENLPEKYHILTGAVIYKAYTKPELQERTNILIAEIESGSKYVSMECFFKGFDYGLINKSNNQYKILSRDNNTAYLSKYLRAYGGMGEHDNYKIGRVLRNITFSGKGYVDKPANSDSIIFSKDNFKFTENINLSKNEDISKSGVIFSQSNINSENQTMNENTEVVETVVVDCAEATQAAQTTIAELNSQIESIKTSHEEVLASLKSENESLAKMHEDEKKKMEDEKKKMEEEKKKMQASVEELETKLTEADTVLAGYMVKEKKMARKNSLLEKGLDSDKANLIVEKFDSLNDETFAAMTELLSASEPKNYLEEGKKIKKNNTVTKAETNTDITEILENVEETTDISITVGGEEDHVENTRAALVDFVYARLGKKLNKGE